ncbi:MAG: helicase RepA family protein [Spirochaetaceae bacterium]|nr:helicase RepA family protein [Spirochaetaceae bacterium]
MNNPRPDISGITETENNCFSAYIKNRIIPELNITDIVSSLNMETLEALKIAREKIPIDISFDVASIISVLLQEGDKYIKAVKHITYLNGLDVLPSSADFYKSLVIKNSRDLKLKELSEQYSKGLLNTEDYLVKISELDNLSTYSNRDTFKLVHISELEVKPPEWLIDYYIPEQSLGSYYGEPETFKSFLALDAALCIATGTPFFNRSVKQGFVIYIAGEGQAGIKARCNAWSIARGAKYDSSHIYFSTMPIELTNNNFMQAVAKEIERIIKETGKNPSVCFIDTWSRNLGGDDSSPKDSGDGIMAIDRLRARFKGFSVITINHSGHTAKDRSRGWSGFRAALDFEFKVERDNDVVRIECTKFKDGERVAPMAFQKAIIELGTFDKNGTPVTSLVFNPIDWTPTETPVDVGLGKNQKIAIDILKQLSEENENVPLDLWKEKCKENGLDRNQMFQVQKSLVSKDLIKINNISNGAAGVVMCVVLHCYYIANATNTTLTKQHIPVVNVANTTLYNKCNALPENETKQHDLDLSSEPALFDRGIAEAILKYLENNQHKNTDMILLTQEINGDANVIIATANRLLEEGYIKEFSGYLKVALFDIAVSG